MNLASNILKLLPILWKYGFFSSIYTSLTRYISVSYRRKNVRNISISKVFIYSISIKNHVLTNWYFSKIYCSMRRYYGITFVHNTLLPVLPVYIPLKGRMVSRKQYNVGRKVLILQNYGRSVQSKSLSNTEGTEIYYYWCYYKSIGFVHLKLN